MVSGSEDAKIVASTALDFSAGSEELTLNLDSSEPVTLGNAIQLEQVIMNLLTNARDAVSVARERKVLIETLVAEERLIVSVLDTGPGIPHELEQKVFDPFFTTKEVGAGTGLGLSISYGIIVDHGGTIMVNSGTGDGTTFTIGLPLERTPQKH